MELKEFGSSADGCGVYGYIMPLWAEMRQQENGHFV